MKVILQHDERDCGAACLAMVAAHYGHRVPISRCRELTRTDRSGTNLYGLTDGAARLGLRASALQGSPEELTREVEAGAVCFPFVAHIVSDEGMLHYIVVYGRKRGRFLIADPGKGKRRLTQRQFFRLWTGYIVTFEKTAAFQEGNETRGSFTKFFALLRGQKRKLAGILALSLLISAIGIFGSFVFQIVLDHMMPDYAETAVVEPAEPVEDGHDHDHGEEGPLDRLLGEVAAYAGRFDLLFPALIGMYLFQAVLQLARSALIILLARRIDLRLALSYYHHIITLPVASVSVRQTGEYLSRFSDAATIRQAVSTATLTLLMDTLMAAACGVILYTQNARLFFVTFVMVAVYAAVVLLFRKPIRRSNRRMMERDAVLQSYFKESIDGVETVKAACAEEQVRQKATEKFHSFLSAVVRSSGVAALQETVVDAVEMVGTAAILWIGFSMALAGVVSVGSVITFYALLAYFTGPIQNLIALQPTIQTALVAADRLNDILELQSEAQDDAAKPLPQVQRWELRNVDFRYGNRELTLRKVNLTLRRGERIAIVGESGSGKTTLARLLLRFYEPESGEILLDGEPIRRFDLRQLRESIAYVDQNTFLFSDTVGKNLRLGRPDASQAEVEAACRASCAEDFIARLPMGYDTPLDENGMNLSGGQRQRLAIARALLKKPQLLILDEAASHLDAMTEASLQEGLAGLDGSLTSILIVHRLTTAKNCDRIYVMEQGAVAEWGTHEELLRKNGLYKKLWERQMM